MTAGQLEDYLTSLGLVKQNAVPVGKKYVYGISGIRELFGCSAATAQKYKNGKIKSACTQIGRKIIVDVDKAIQLANE